MIKMNNRITIRRGKNNSIRFHKNNETKIYIQFFLTKLDIL